MPSFSLSILFRGLFAISPEINFRAGDAMNQECQKLQVNEFTILNPLEVRLAVSDPAEDLWKALGFDQNEFSPRLPQPGQCR